MTTIAFDGKTLACDSRVTRRNEICRAECRKIGFWKGVLYGSAGSLGSIIEFSGWIKRGRPKELPNIKADDNFSAIVVENGKCFLYHDPQFIPLHIGWPAGCGSGGDFATAAMLAGADARQAVKIAIRLDTGSGGRVHALTINEPANVTNNGNPKRPARRRTKRRAG